MMSNVFKKFSRVFSVTLVATLAVSGTITAQATPANVMLAGMPDLAEEGMFTDDNAAAIAFTDDEAAAAAADVENLADLIEEGILDTSPLFADTTSAANIVKTAKKLIGKGYSTGAVGPNSFDCSGYVSYILKGYGLDTPRTSREMSQYHMWASIDSPDDLMMGDLVFFMSPGSGSSVGHVGIYLGDDQFIHCTPANRKGVTISYINSDYYTPRFKGGRRIFG